MLNTIFDTIFITTNESTSIAQFLLCIAVSLLLGFFFAIVYRYKNHATQSFLITLALLPATVCAIILMVNGTDVLKNALFLLSHHSKFPRDIEYYFRSKKDRQKFQKVCVFPCLLFLQI
jgi:predicted tellurium resistance membrane protein TerC